MSEAVQSPSGYIQQQTGNKLATILLPIYKQHVDGNKQHIAYNMLPWCKRGFRVMLNIDLMLDIRTENKFF